VLLTDFECNWTWSVGSKDLRFADHQVNCKCTWRFWGMTGGGMRSSGGHRRENEFTWVNPQGYSKELIAWKEAREGFEKFPNMNACSKWPPRIKVCTILGVGGTKVWDRTLIITSDLVSNLLRNCEQDYMIWFRSQNFAIRAQI